ncbi:MAG: hypothetical protein FD123_1517 [Bacteroidetes bacterium]|nr:MAG: hypothetical protein FD123_1517 [Bacteroidota bacterium]
MDTDEKPLNEQASLALINRMINSAQQGVSDNGFYFLLWGWLVFAAAMGNWTLIHVFPTELNWLPWAILMPLGGIVSGIYGWKVERKKKVKTYADEVMDYVAAAFLIALFSVLFVFSWKLGWATTYPFIMIIYGIWLFVSGGVLKFRPLIYGGLINFACAIGSLWIHSYHMILVLAFAVLAGYIIPGHLLKAKYNREKHNAAV